jgi:hypothetical protein
MLRVACSYAFDYGLNFMDTAEMYPVPPTKETQVNVNVDKDACCIVQPAAWRQLCWSLLRSLEQKAGIICSSGGVVATAAVMTASVVVQ